MATRIAVGLFCVFLCLGSWVQARPLMVVGTPETPFKMLRKGKATGIDVRVMRQVLEELNIDHEIRLVNSGARLMREGQMGAVDVVLSVSFSNERTQVLTYPETSYKSISWHFFIRKGDQNRLSFESLDDLADERIGAVRSWAYTDAFWEAGLNRRLVADHRLLLHMLQSGRIDAAPMNTAATLYRIREEGLQDQISFLPKPLTSRPYYNTFVKRSDHPALPKLKAHYDRIIQRMKQDGTLTALYREYLGDDVAWTP